MLMGRRGKRGSASSTGARTCRSRSVSTPHRWGGRGRRSPARCCRQTSLRSLPQGGLGGWGATHTDTRVAMRTLWNGFNRLEFGGLGSGVGSQAALAGGLRVVEAASQASTGILALPPHPAKQKPGQQLSAIRTDTQLQAPEAQN